MIAWCRAETTDWMNLRFRDVRARISPPAVWRTITYRVDCAISQIRAKTATPMPITLQSRTGIGDPAEVMKLDHSVRAKRSAAGGMAPRTKRMAGRARFGGVRRRFTEVILRMTKVWLPTMKREEVTVTPCA